MRLSFPSELYEIRDGFQRMFVAEAVPERARAVAAGEVGWDVELWRKLGELGWLGVCVEERFGGMAQDPLVQCLLAEVFGSRLAAIPFASHVLGWADAIGIVGDATLSEEFLPGAVAGEIIGGIVPAAAWTTLEIKGNQADGGIAALTDGAALTHVLTVQGEGSATQVILLDVARSRRERMDSLDRINQAWSLQFKDAPARIVAEGASAAGLWERIVARHAIYLSFVQIGGAVAALEAACAHVNQRYAFGRPLGSFQGIKHALADALAAIEIGRSNAWFAAASLRERGDALTEAAAAARVSATAAYRQAARAYVHYLGGIGVTAESDSHLFYRRAQALGTVIGSPSVWREKLIAARLRDRAIGATA
ncbi:MAG: acyl-CoA dehydrogenase family protein [Steroidobacteraceae bacterium]